MSLACFKFRVNLLLKDVSVDSGGLKMSAADSIVVVVKPCGSQFIWSIINWKALLV